MEPGVYQSDPAAPLKIELGCGGAKREGFIGLDCVNAPCVDVVLDLTKDRLPFADGTVDHVFSAHFLEHIPSPNHVFREIARVCRDGAKIEIWTPYAYSDPAFLYGHLVFLSELQWYFFCCAESNRDYHLDILGGRWLLRNIHYVVPIQVQKELIDNGFTIDFAIRYFKGVVQEFGVEIEFRRDLSLPAVIPSRTYAQTRIDERISLPGLFEVPPLGVYQGSARGAGKSQLKMQRARLSL